MHQNNVTSLRTFLLLTTLFILGSTGCYYDVEEDFKKMVDCNTDGVSYTNDIVPILQNRCYKCHAEGLNLGNVTLEGYDRLKLLVNSGRFLGAIRRDPGFSPMPQNEAMLPDCQIMKISAWIEAGAPNN